MGQAASWAPDERLNLVNAITTTGPAPQRWGRRCGKQWLARLLAASRLLVASLVLAGLLAGLNPSAGLAAAAATPEESVYTAGSYEVAPVRILKFRRLWSPPPKCLATARGG